MTTHNWEIRPAREADVSEVLVLERASVSAPHWAAAEYMAALRAQNGVRRCLFIAKLNDELGGFAVGSVVGDAPNAEAELESVVVAESLRRQGLGSALCRAVMEWSHREGAGVILLEVRAASRGALQLYGGLGFVAIGRRQGYYRDPNDDAVVMRCAMQGASSGSVAPSDV